MSDNINTGDGGKGKRGDILRGILKIRRKRNSSVTKASSRERSSLSRLVNSSKIPGTCPSCSLAYDRANKRRLVDSCGHERCYSCIGKNEKCALCLQMGHTENQAPSISCKNRYSVSLGDPNPGNVVMSSTPVNTLERSKRSRFDSLLNISNTSTNTPENSLPRRRKEVTRRQSQDTQSLHLSHANLASKTISRNSSGTFHHLLHHQDMPRPLYFEVPQPVPSPLVGRQWLWHEMRDHLSSHLPTNRGVTITGGPGSGKTAVILAMVERSCFGHQRDRAGYEEIPVTSDTQTQSEDNLNYLARQIVGYHFCQSDNSPTCHVSQFVHSLAAQLSQCPQLSAYHHLLQSDVNILNHLSWISCNINPTKALIKGILEPLTELEKSGKITVGMGIIVIDGLCEAEHHRPDYGDTLATFIGRHSSSFPTWLKIVATIRTNFVDTYKLLPFHRICLDTTEDERIKKDLSDYIASRINVTQLANRLIHKNSSRLQEKIITKFTHFLVSKASGCFLYVKLILDLVEKGNLSIKSGSFKVVPQNLSEIYQLAFNLKFSSSESFVQVGDILSICLASLQPISLYQLYLAYTSLYITSEIAWKQFKEKYQTIADVLIMRKDGTLMCFHPTMRDWLLRKRGDRDKESEVKFMSDTRLGHSAIALYLSRHQPQPEMQNTEKLLAMAHHILKSNIYKNTQNVRFSTRQLQACFTSLSMEDISLALSCMRNIYSPIIKVSRLLLLAGADPNQMMEQDDQCPLLGVHCRLGHTDMVSLLLEYGADPNLCNNCGVPPISLASGEGHLDIVTLLLQCGADIHKHDMDGVSSIVAAARSGHLNVVEHLLDQDWSPESMEDIAGGTLTQALLYNQLEVAEFLLDVPDINMDKHDNISSLNCLAAAAMVGNINFVEKILEKAGDRIDKGKAILAVGSTGNMNVLQYLLSQGSDVHEKDERGRSVLMISSSHGHTDIMECLINAGVDLEGSDNEGLTPLTHAIINNQTGSAAVLLKRGADINSLDSSARSPLDVAIYQGSVEMVELLLDNGANMEHPDKRGIKPLDRVIGHGNSSIVSVFLRKGAKLGSATWAMAQGKPDIQLILLNKLMDDGNTLYRQNRLNEAAHRYKYALKRLGSITSCDWSNGGMINSDWPIEMETNLLLNLSRVERRLGRFETAMQLASKVLDFKPSCVQALCTRAKAARSLGMARDAFVDFNTALDLMPGNRELKRVILKMKDGFRNEMSSSFMSFSSDSIKFMDDCSVDMESYENV